MDYNSFMLSRLIIITNDGRTAYDEKFHEGINIIRGQNSSGKSTIAHFIFYVLGASFKDWIAEVMSCRCVYGEIRFNNHVICLRRYISYTIEPDGSPRYNDKTPIEIYYGTYDELLNNNDESRWARFGYKSTPEIKSFSNELFTLFGFPIVKAENNITMHQLLRLMYIDQMSPTASYFYFEPFDSDLTRSTVADLMLGCYDEDLYEAKSKATEIKNSIAKVRAEIKTMRLAIPVEQLEEAYINTMIGNLLKQLSDLESNIVILKSGKQISRLKKKDAYTHALETIQQLRSQIAELELKWNLLSADISDSEMFISAIMKKIKNIKESINTRKALQDVPLLYCPECLGKLHEVKGNICRLCKSPLPENKNIHRIMNLKTEYEFQIKESQALLVKKKHDLNEMDAILGNLKTRLLGKRREAANLSKLSQSPRDEDIDDMLKLIGEKNNELKTLEALKAKAHIYAQLIEREGELISEEKKTDEFIKLHQYQLERKKQHINNVVESFALEILHNDEEREHAFKEAEHVVINYNNNIAYIPGAQGGFSASSQFLLKLASRFALFLASINVADLRYPRFILCDNMEDKGMEQDRAQAFQRSLIKLCEEHHKTNYQVIYATSMLPEELEGSPYCVGESYNANNKALKYV